MTGLRAPTMRWRMAATILVAALGVATGVAPLKWARCPHHFAVFAAAAAPAGAATPAPGAPLCGGPMAPTPAAHGRHSQAGASGHGAHNPAPHTCSCGDMRCAGGGGAALADAGPLSTWVSPLVPLGLAPVADTRPAGVASKQLRPPAVGPPVA